MRIKGRDVFCERVKIEIKKHLAFFFIGIKKVFGVVAREPAANPGDHGSILVMALPKFGFEHKCVLLLFKKWDDGNYILNKRAVFADLYQRKRPHISDCLSR